MELCTPLDPFDDLVDWLEGARSQDHLIAILKGSRQLTSDEAADRARRGSFFAGSAVDFIDSARNARPQAAFLPCYYAILNLSKLMLACSDDSSSVDGALYHGAAYPVAQKNSQFLFTEIVNIHPDGVFAKLYRLLSGRSVPLRKRDGKKRPRALQIRNVYDRLFGVGAEYSRCSGAAPTKFACVTKVAKRQPTKEHNGQARWSAKITTFSNEPFSATQVLPPFPQWEQDTNDPYTWYSPALSTESAELDQVICRQLLALPSRAVNYEGRFILPHGRLCFTDQLAIFLALFHLSSIVRYKPRFMDVIQQSDAWPLVLCARRHLLYEFVVATLSFLFQRN